MDVRGVSLFVLHVLSACSSLDGITVEDCGKSWSCSWDNSLSSDLTKGTCFLKKEITTTSSPPNSGPGLVSLDVYCLSHPNSAYRVKAPNDIFECMSLLVGETKVTQLLLSGCELLEIDEDDLKKFSFLEELNITSTSIKSIHDKAFYSMDRLVTITINQEHAQNGISEYPTALIGEEASSTTSTSKTNYSREFLPNLRHLILETFLFHSGIPLHAFQHVNGLTLLTLRSNNLSNLDFESMTSLYNLTFLHISDSHAIDSIPTDLLSFLPSLISFELSGTSIQGVNKNDLRYQQNLHHLSLSNNLLSYIDSAAFSHMKYLTTLDLNNNPFLGTGQHFSFLEGLNRLENFDLSNCLFRNISTDEFQYVPGLRALSLKKNQLWTIPILFANLPGIPALTDIERVDLSRNEIFAVKSYIFSNLPKLKIIDLSYNSIIVIPSRMFFNLAVIEEIFLNHNLINDYEPMSLSYIDTLETLDLRDNNFFNFPKLIGANSMVGINGIPENPFQTYLEGNIMFCECEMFLDLFEFKNGQWERKFASTYSWPGSIFLHNQVFDRSKLYCHTFSMGVQLIDQVLQDPWNFFTLLDPKEDCPAVCFCYESCGYILRIVICVNSNLTNIPEDISPETTYLDLFNNSIVRLDKDFFSRVPLLRRIDLSFNRISLIESGTFYHCDQLLDLILHNNNLKEIDLDNFNISSSSLQRLDLSHNLISRIHNNSFQMVSTLERLEIGNNKLGGIPNGLLDNLNKLSYLSLSGNPFNCSCNLLYFTEWYTQIVFERGKSLQTDISDIECGQILNETEIYAWIKETEEICNPSPTADSVTKFVIINQIVPEKFADQWKTFVPSLFGVILSAITICGVLYKFQLELRVFIYFKTGWKIFGSRDNDEEKEFDAFISFSSLDRDFVLEELLPKLENNANSRKLCIHHRDFVVGACIATNIVHAIENSKRIVILCSNNYLQSEWCSYEFRTSHQKALKDRINRIVLIMMEDVDKQYLEKEIKAYISTKTYFDKKDPLFWHKLADAIPQTNSRDREEEYLLAESDEIISMSELNVRPNSLS